MDVAPVRAGVERKRYQRPDPVSRAAVLFEPNIAAYLLLRHSERVVFGDMLHLYHAEVPAAASRSSNAGCVIESHLSASGCTLKTSLLPRSGRKGRYLPHRIEVGTLRSRYLALVVALRHGMEARRAETPVVAEAAPLATARRRRRTPQNGQEEASRSSDGWPVSGEALDSGWDASFTVLMPEDRTSRDTFP